MKTLTIIAAILLLFPTGGMGGDKVVPQIIAHRGYWKAAEGAKNSITALEKAGEFQEKYDIYGSEFDVNMTADSQLVVCHGPKAGTISAVQKATFDEVRQQKLENGEAVPTLDEYLEAAKDLPIQLILEVKTHSSIQIEKVVVAKVVEAVKAHGLEKKIDFISFSINICDEIRRLLPEATIFYLNGDLSPKQIVEHNLSGISYSFSVLDSNARWISQAQKLGLKVNVWTVNDPKKMTKMVTYDVNYITTDDPELCHTQIDTYNTLKKQKMQ
ncbi:MAG: glycerophosphodiester phosphodiesterase family protein [Bacteroidales bacterium]|nr:glycerophosphodiester phosphodiesterase family protein [Bacteroidales bacterium]